MIAGRKKFYITVARAILNILDVMIKIYQFFIFIAAVSHYDIPANEMIFHACAVFLIRCSVRFRLRTIEYAALNLPCLVSKILAHPQENHFVRGYIKHQSKIINQKLKINCHNAVLCG